MTYGDVLNLAMEKSKGECDVFVEYSPHVNRIYVCIYPKGWGNSTSTEHIEYMKDTSPQQCIDFINTILQNDSTEEHY